ncbi:hypothetical protein ABZX56_11020 [Streptomyces parvulus]|uniref:hypothetical protein n=1 Tax=Streptomyces parvulus TaxID=146923 RepID=UPI0033A6BFDE
MIPVCPGCGRAYPCICPPRAVIAIVAAAAALALLAGCGAGAGPSGTVTEKEHEDARTTWRTEPKTKQECTSRRTSTGTTRSCRTVPDGTRRVRDVKPECWELELDTGDEVCVDEDLWNRTAVGDEYGGE